MINNKFVGILFIIAFLITFFLVGGARANGGIGQWNAGKEARELLEVPPPSQNRKYEPHPNQLMVVTYSNDRVFLYRINKIIPKPHCNQISYDARKRVIRITTQAVSQAYEYVLESKPIMVSDWIPYEN